MADEKSLEERIECPSCKEKTLVCKYNGDMGAGDAYYDEYEAYCKSCGYSNKEIIYGGVSNWDDWYTSCPYCGLETLDHPTDFDKNQNS